MLKGAPDHALVGYVQNPNGQVPTYLALSELQRRKEMRASYQANKPEEKSVAEDLVQESEPQPGVAGLPAGQPMQQAMQPPAEMPVQQMAQGGLADLSMDNQMFNEENYATGGIVAFADRGYVDANRYVNPSLTELPEVPEDQLSYWEKVKRRYAKMKEKEALDIATENRRQQTPWFGKGGYDQTKDSAYVPPPKVDNPPAPGVDNTVKASDLPIASKSQVGYAPPELNIPGQLSIDQAMTDRKRAMELAGVPTDFYQQQADLNKTDREALKDERSQAGWMALARAGFGAAAGKSPFALQNIAEGAVQGAEQYGKDVKDIKAEQRLLKQADQKLAEAQYLQQRGDAEGAMKKISEREALVQDYNKLQYSGNIQLQAAKIAASKPTDMGMLLDEARKDTKYYTKKDGKAVFDLSKALDDIKGYGNKVDIATLKTLSDELKTTFDPTKRAEIQAKIDAIMSGSGDTSISSALPTGTVVTRTK